MKKRRPKMKIGDAVAIINLAENQAEKFEEIVDSIDGFKYEMSKQELENTANILRKMIRLIEDREM
jgi:ribosomal protein L22